MALTGAGEKLRYKYPLSLVHILKLKAHGKSSTKSSLLNRGVVFNAQGAMAGMPTFIEAANANTPVKIAMLNMNMQRHHMGTGV